jgi:beta-lactam-binding protein with PASTA domain
MKIVVGEGIIQRTARWSLALALATVEDGMTRASRSRRRWAALGVLAMCFFSSVAAGQDPQKMAKPPERVMPAMVTSVAGQVKCAPKTIEQALHLQQMPDVVGCDFKAMANMVQELERHAPQRVDVSSSSPADQIERQAPAPGDELSPQSTITLYVSLGQNETGPKPNAMPSLIGRTFPEAQIILRKMSLPSPSPRDGLSDRAKGQIYAQDPVPGTTLMKGQPIIVSVSTASDGKKTLPVMPKFIGQPYKNAEGVLEQMQLPHPNRQNVDSNQPAELVIGQTPDPGTAVQGATEVTLQVSRGSVRVPGSVTTTPTNPPVATPVSPLRNVVPEVVGMTPDQAISTLNSAGFASVTVGREFHPAMPNRVFHQDPQPGVSVDAKTEVSLEVSTSAGATVVAAGLLAGVAGIAAGLWSFFQRHLIKITRQQLHIKPSLGPGSETHLAHALEMGGPAIALRPRLEMGKVIFAGPVSIERQEISHD